MLRGVREEAREGAYTLVLEFETKEQMTLDMWESRVGKIQSFFGPGINAEVQTPRPAAYGPLLLFSSDLQMLQQSDVYCMTSSCSTSLM